MQRLAIKINEDEWVLHGSGKAVGLQGCQRNPTQRLPNGACLEKLDLILQGNPNRTRALIIQLQSLIERLRLGQPAWLCLQPDAEVAVYQSRLLAADFQWITGSVQVQGIGIRLEMQREDFWQLPWQPLPLSNRYGTAVTDGIRIDNRADANGQNWCSIAGEGLQGDLPAPVRIRILHDVDANTILDQIFIGWGSTVTLPLPPVEGEMAESNLNYGGIIHAAYHGGGYGLVQWDTTAAIRLLSWVLPGAEFNGLGSRQLRPLVRLVNPPGLTADTWVWWKLFHGSLVYQSSPQLLSRERALQALPLICLPANPLSGEPWNDLYLEIHAQNRTAGNHQLAVDAIFLFYTDGWRQFQTMENGKLEFGQTLIDTSDQVQPFVQLSHTHKNQRAYQAQGNGLWVLPGQNHLLQFLVDAGSEMPLDVSFHLKLEYQPRRRMLP